MTATGRGRLPARRAFVLQLEFGTNFLPNTSALCFAGPITLVGAGAATTIIDGDQRAHVAVVGNNGPVEIRGGGRSGTAGRRAAPCTAAAGGSTPAAC